MIRTPKWSALAVGLLLAPAAVADQVINDDVIATFSMCVGTDCVNGEAFSYDTIRLKENNTRIRFYDTSVSASFPTNDWQLTANDSTNGGVNHFSIDDIDSGRTPFRVEAGARNYALYVDGKGRLGLGTNTPLVEMHEVSGNTPSLRLEQDASEGYTPQVWDVGANEANFFLRDLTNSGQLPFRVTAGAPSSSLDIDGSGNVGMGTNSPLAFLHIKRSVGAGVDPLTGAGIRIETSPSSAETSLGLVVTNNGPVANAFQDEDAGEIWTETIGAGNYMIEEAGAGATALTLAANGNMTIGGVLSEGSSRHIKHGFQDVDQEKVLASVMALQISRWKYRTDEAGTEHMGPMAEDFHAAFGLGQDAKHLAAIDASGVALASVQALNQRLEQQNRSLADKNAQLTKRIDKLEKLVDRLLSK